MAIWGNTKKKQRSLHYAYTNTFNLDDAFDKTVLMDLCEAHGVFDGGFSLDPIQNAFNAGERNAVLRILTILKMTPEDILALEED
ncbi:MAG: hypothetical protein GY820_17055 [Gammaproteobacteria bacterium]|nr:hypothetical protein [Gammaproteobacteria bacterium]